jgi:hypothetical protein
MNPRVRLILTVCAFLSWIGWLGLTVAMKSRSPIVSRIQSAAATTAVVAEMGGPTGPVTVSEVLWGEGPRNGPIELINLEDARGFNGPGKYLLYLAPRHGGWVIVGDQRSPGGDSAGIPAAMVYPWNDDVRIQAEKFRR